MLQKGLAAVAVEEKRTEIKEFIIPEISSDSGLLRVEATGVCGSDWPLYLKTKEPRILGHHVVGRIEKVGSEAAKKWGVKEGDRVALEEYLPCGSCRHCRTGQYRLCDETDLWLGGLRYGATATSLAPSLWGGYSHYLYLHPHTVLHPMPEHVPPEEAALALPISNGVEWACIEGGAGIGHTVVIQGPGQQGLACVLAAKAAGAECVIVSGLSMDESRLEAAKSLGADYTVNVQTEDLVERVADITGGQGAHLVIDCSSGGVDTIAAAIKVATKRGTIILGGFKHQAIPQFYSDDLISKFLTVKGVRGHGYKSVEQAIEIISSGKYPLRKMTTHRYRLEEVDRALKTIGGEGDEQVISATVLPWT